MKRCPFCAEEIQDAAILCRWCGRDLVKAPSTMKACWSCGSSLQRSARQCLKCGETQPDSGVVATSGAGQAIYSVSGRGCSMQVFEDRLTIAPQGAIGLWMRGLKGTKTIPFSSITALQHKQAGFVVGYLQFSIKGGLESRAGVQAAVRDENTFTYGNASDNRLIGEIKEFIEARLR